MNSVSQKMKSSFMVKRSNTKIENSPSESDTEIEEKKLSYYPPIPFGFKKDFDKIIAKNLSEKACQAFVEYSRDLKEINEHTEKYHSLSYNLLDQFKKEEAESVLKCDKSESKKTANVTPSRMSSKSCLTEGPHGQNCQIVESDQIDDLENYVNNKGETLKSYLEKDEFNNKGFKLDFLGAIKNLITDTTQDGNTNLNNSNLTNSKVISSQKNLKVYSSQVKSNMADPNGSKKSLASISQNQNSTRAFDSSIRYNLNQRSESLINVDNRNIHHESLENSNIKAENKNVTMDVLPIMSERQKPSETHNPRSNILNKKPQPENNVL